MSSVVVGFSQLPAEFAVGLTDGHSSADTEKLKA